VLALLPDDLAVDWSRAATERWAAAREGVEDGRIAAVVGTVVVGAPPRG